MKTFKDLEFKSHPNGMGLQAKMNFPDGSEISVICGASHYYCGNDTFEMMSNRTNARHGVKGWLTPEQITRHMIYIQKNPLSKQ